METFGWNEFIHSLPGLIAGLTALFGSLTIFYRKGVKPMINAVKRYQKLLSRVDHIFDELSPNGGSSIYDVISRIEKSVSLSSERQRAILADNEYAVFETDADGNFIWVNRTYVRWVQRSMGELVGHGWVNGIHHQDRDKMVSDWYDAVQENREYTGKFRLTTPSGVVHEVACNSYKMTDSRGKILGYLGLVKPRQDCEDDEENL